MNIEQRFGELADRADLAGRKDLAMQILELGREVLHQMQPRRESEEILRMIECATHHLRNGLVPITTAHALLAIHPQKPELQELLASGIQVIVEVQRQLHAEAAQRRGRR